MSNLRTIFESEFFEKFLENFFGCVDNNFSRQRHDAKLRSAPRSLENLREHQIYPAMLVILTNVLEP